MLSIARPLARDIKLLLLDEPYEGLAPVIVDEIEKTLQVIKEQGITTIIVEQKRSTRLNLADRSVILDTGSVVFDGSAKKVLTTKSCVRNIWLSDLNSALAARNGPWSGAL